MADYADKLVYMDATDYLEMLGSNWNGVEVYPTSQSVQVNSKCVSTCGLLEVKVVFSKIVSPGGGEQLMEPTVEDVQTKSARYWAWQEALLTSWKAHRVMLQERLRLLDANIKQKELELF